VVLQKKKVDVSNTEAGSFSPFDVFVVFESLKMHFLFFFFLVSFFLIQDVDETPISL